MNDCQTFVTNETLTDIKQNSFILNIKKTLLKAISRGGSSIRDFKDISGTKGYFQKEFKVINLINGYRNRGHLFTKTNPVRDRRKYSPTLDISNFGLDESDLDQSPECQQTKVPN